MNVDGDRTKLLFPRLEVRAGGHVAERGGVLLPEVET